MRSPLPQFISSLSKYYRVEDHYPLVASIVEDTPESDLRARFDRDLYATGKQRYLTVKNGIVLRDKLVRFIQEEDGFTERVKMVMYFLFMFRDSRYREFICERVAKNGRWRTEIFRDKQSEHFRNSGGRKAFTNLRQFLFQTGVLDEQTLTVHIPNLSTWFPRAAEVAAQSIEDSNARKAFLRDPTAFLIKYKINALLNALPEELSGFNIAGTSDNPAEGPVPIEFLQEISTFRLSTPEKWNRSTPTKHQRKTLISETDPIALERANEQHYDLESRVYAMLIRRKLEPKTTVHMDLVVENAETSVIFEMKSCGAGAIRNQLRRAISQLLEYRFIYREYLKPNVLLCAVLERKPAGRVTWLADYADSLGIGLIWKNDQNDGMHCTAATQAMLGGILPEVSPLS